MSKINGDIFMKTKNKVLTAMLAISLAVVSGALITLRNNAPVESKAADLTDTLVATNFAATGTKYTDFSYTSTGNEITYVGNSAKSTAGAIQLRSSNSNSGIISTTTKGTIKSVTVVWDSGTTSGRTLDIYGSNTAYSGSNAAALYSSSTQGTKLGSIVNGKSTTISPEENYSYIGLRSYSGAMYLTSIAIVWAEPSVEPTVSLDSTSKLSYIGSGDISLSVANVANMVTPYTYSWSITSGTSATIPASSTESMVSATPSSSVTGETVIRCTVTDSTEGTPLSAYAECTITIENVLSVAELLASTDESSYFVKGYIISDDNGSTNNSKFDMVDASAGVNTNN